MSTKTDYLFCDICDTVYRSNTTFDFLKYFLSKHSRSKAFVLQLLSARWSPVLYLLLVVGKIIHTDVVRKISLKLLSGYTQDRVEESATLFVRSFLRNRLNTEVAILLQVKSASEKIVFVSSSIEPVVKAIAADFGYPFFASTLETKNNLLTGSLRVDLTGKKHEVVEQFINDRMASVRFAVVTDNQTDFQLVSMASERYIVVTNEAQKEFWRELNPEFIMI